MSLVHAGLRIEGFVELTFVPEDNYMMTRKNQTEHGSTETSMNEQNRLMIELNKSGK